MSVGRWTVHPLRRLRALQTCAVPQLRLPVSPDYRRGCTVHRTTDIQTLTLPELSHRLLQKNGKWPQRRGKPKVGLRLSWSLAGSNRSTKCKGRETDPRCRPDQSFELQKCAAH